MSNESWIKKLKDYELSTESEVKITKTLKKKYCKNWVENRCKCGRLINGFCKYYRGSTVNIESCAYKCECGAIRKVKHG